MEREEFGALWEQLKIHLLTRWDRLTNEDLNQINGSYDLFVAKVEEKYGLSRGEIEEQFHNWTPALDVEDAEFKETPEERENFPVKTWVIAGILLAILLGYWSYSTTAVPEANAPNAEESRSSVPVTQDETISQKVRSALSQNSKISKEMNNIGIKTENGVVTISGTVSTEEDKSTVGAIADKIPGVMSVENELKIKP